MTYRQGSPASRRGVSLAAALLLLLSVLAPQLAAAQAPALRVMTFNIRLPHPGDGANVWEKRRALTAAMIAEADPDLFGTQELFKEQADYLVSKLPRYGWIGTGRRGGHSDEHMGLFYRLDRLKLVDMGNFWLSETPDVPGSISWGHPFPRMVTWALFESRRDGRRFYAFNTHFPYRKEDDAARMKCAEMLRARIRQIAGDAPVVLTGDFNTTPDTPVHALLTADLADAWQAAPRRSGPAETFHGFTGKADRRIDWILLDGFRALEARTITRHRGVLQTSDHFPVVAELAWP